MFKPTINENILKQTPYFSTIKQVVPQSQLDISRFFFVPVLLSPAFEFTVEDDKLEFKIL